MCQSTIVLVFIQLIKLAFSVNILVESDRIPEAVFFAQTYCPVGNTYELWQIYDPHVRFAIFGKTEMSQNII